MKDRDNAPKPTMQEEGKKHTHPNHVKCSQEHKKKKCPPPKYARGRREKKRKKRIEKM